MPIADVPAGAQAAAEGSGRRWAEMLDSLARLLPAETACVLVDGPDGRADLFAARLARALLARGRPVRLATAPGAACDMTIFLRTGPAKRAAGGRPPLGERSVPGEAAARREPDDRARREPDDRARREPDDRARREPDDPRREREDRADIVIDLHDTDWPVIRRVAAPLEAGGPWYLTETRAFFACRAATWDAKFGDDLPAYQAAVAEAGIGRGGVVIDVGCGTGRALPPLRGAVGRSGAVIALDVTPEMLQAARKPAAIAEAALVLADARAVPFADRSVDAIFAAGLVSHLPDTVAGLRELARVTRPGGLLVLFHPSGRAALAARHGRELSADEPLAEHPLRTATAASGWTLTAYDDAAHRFFAVAQRR